MSNIELAIAAIIITFIVAFLGGMACGKGYILNKQRLKTQ